VDPGSASILRLLEEQPGEAPAYVDDLLEILSAGTYEAGILGIEPGAPLARVTSTACLADDTPLACIQTVVPGGRFRAVRRQDQP